MNTPHKHAALIKAWADGAKVEHLTFTGWYETNSPRWDFRNEYRIKPHRWQAEMDAEKAGEVVQGRFCGDPEWADGGPWAWDDNRTEYRIKPEMLRYRIALMRHTAQNFDMQIARGEGFAEKIEGRSHFVRWLGDWQEVEA